MASLERFPRRAGVASVAARTELTPRMLRLTLAAEDFGPAWPIQQSGEILTLLFAAADEAIVLPEQGWRFPEAAPEQAWRNYTVRAHRPEMGEVDVDVVLHEPRGPACTGAAASVVGFVVGYAGPRVDFAPEDGAEWLLLCGDETALPAIASILETAPGDQPVTAIVEVADADERLEVPLGERQELHWVGRGGAAAGTGTALADAVRAFALPSGDGQAWGAAESRIARDLRSVLRDEHGMDKRRARARGTGCAPANGTSANRPASGRAGVTGGLKARPLQPLSDSPLIQNVPGGCESRAGACETLQITEAGRPPKRRALPRLRSKREIQWGVGRTVESTVVRR